MMLTVTFLVSASTVADCRADEPFPVLFTYQFPHDADHRRPPRAAYAAGFSHDSRTLALWFRDTLVLLDAESGETQAKVALELSGLRVAAIAFDASDRYCCLAAKTGKEFSVQIVDVQERRAARTVTAPSAARWDWQIRDYEPHYPAQPLRRILAIEHRQDRADSNCAADFPATCEQSAERRWFHVSVFGREEIAGVAAADRAYANLAGSEQTASIRQVDLSDDGTTLVTQRFAGPGTNYLFRCYDTATRNAIAEFGFAAGPQWRSNSSKGFAFSRDFSKLVRFKRFEWCIVHDLGALQERKLHDTKSAWLRDESGTRELDQGSSRSGK